MAPAHGILLLCFTSRLFWAAHGQDVGVNWGTQASHPLLPSTVVQMLKDNHIKKVKLFDADSWTVSAFSGSGIQLMVAIPNNMLHHIGKDYDNAKEWVKKNVTKYLFDGGVDIRYVAVGNEPFLVSYNGSFIKDTFPALKNIQQALDSAGVGDKIKATVPLNADVYDSAGGSGAPSTGDFRDDIHDLMVSIVRFLHSKNSPFVVNIYPFLSLYLNPNFPLDYAFFDGGSSPIEDNGHEYTNVFDANFDTLIHSLKKAGVPDLRVVVGEVGWPTDGDQHANDGYAKRFYDGFLKKMAAKKGTPMRPGPLEVYLFGLTDEDMKSVAPGNFERHWGLFRYDGQPKFPMDLTGKGNDELLLPAKGVQYLEEKWCVLRDDVVTDQAKLGSAINYACSNGDCTSLGYGCSCGGMDLHGNASYAFNMLFQMQDQGVDVCDFQGMARITTRNASRGGCNFPIQIQSAGERAQLSSAASVVALLVLLPLVLF